MRYVVDPCYLALAGPKAKDVPNVLVEEFVALVKIMNAEVIEQTVVAVNSILKKRSSPLDTEGNVQILAPHVRSRRDVVTVGGGMKLSLRFPHESAGFPGNSALSHIIP